MFVTGDRLAKRFNYGGQAVIEGVMMRGLKASVTAVRRPNGEIKVSKKPLSALYTGKMRRMAFLRGVIVLIESMVLGIQSLLYSANVALEEETDELPAYATWLMVAFSLGFSVLLFFLAPLFLTGLVDNFMETSSAVFHIIEGVIRLIIFILYIKIISLYGDIKKVFEYHGAEHATINAYEGGVPLEPEKVKGHSTCHMRCGTSFLLIVLLIAIFVFALVGKQDTWIMVTSRIVLLPFIAAMSYELTQYSARHAENKLIRIIMAPGLWLQNLTTREPNLSQIEVAIAALKKAVAIDEGEESAEEEAKEKASPVEPSQT